MRYLSKRLENATIVEDKPRDTSVVYFSAWVTLEDQANPNAPIQRMRLVGSDEIDSAQNWISIDSPMARALIGKSVDDEVQVTTPEGERYFYIIKIEY